VITYPFYNGIASPVAPQCNLARLLSIHFPGSTIVGDVTLGDGNSKKYTNHNYSGIGGVDFNVSTMTKLHIDVLKLHSQLN
jgi:hypothetical protein